MKLDIYMKIHLAVAFQMVVTLQLAMEVVPALVLNTGLCLIFEHCI